MRFVAFSDTHGFHNCTPLPAGDVLLFSGDMCGRGNLEEVRGFGEYLNKQPHKHKIIIAGNHDWPFELDQEKALGALGDVTYLQDQEVVIEGVKIYGSPWQPEFFDWAFNLPRGQALKDVWAKIPEDTNILLTHGPPNRILDKTSRGVYAGCEELTLRLSELPELKAHIFGHIHEAYGYLEQDGCQFYNASICDLYQREAINSAWVFDI